MHYDHKKSASLTLFKQMKYLYGYRQRDNQDINTYFEYFNAMKDNILRFGGSFSPQSIFVKELMDKDGVDYDDENLAPDVRHDYEQKAVEKWIATAFLLGGKSDTYSDLLSDLENDYLKGKDNFPTSIVGAYHLMANYKQKHTHSRKIFSNRVAFTQSAGSTKSKEEPGTDGILYSKIKCYNCGSHGHYSNKCPHALQDGATDTTINVDGSAATANDTSTFGFGFMQVSMLQSQSRYQGLSKFWILLDTQSNCDIFRNPALLTNIRASPSNTLRLKSNGGELMCNLIGDVTGYGHVWYSPDSMANILSFANIRKRFAITMNTGPNDPQPSIIVHKTDGTKMTFVEHKMGLYVHDVRNKTMDDGVKKAHNPILNNSCVYSYAFNSIATVRDLEKEFTQKEIKKAKAAQSLYRKVGRPGLSTFLRMINGNMITNCDITARDVQRAQYIYGVDAATVRGRAVRDTPNSVPTNFPTPIPQHVRDFHMNVTLCIDIFYIDTIPFFHTISRGLMFRTVEEIKNRTYKQILHAMQNVMNVYEARGYNIVQICADGEFEMLRNSFLPATLEIAAQGIHVPEVERSIRVLKDDFRTAFHGLPFRTLPKILIKYLLLHIVRLRNMFPNPNGLDPVHSPSMLVTGRSKPDMHDFKLEFGTYVICHDHHSITNGMNARGTGAIALTQANTSGAWFFLSLRTGDRIMRQKWTELPMCDDVIDRIHQLATHNDTSDVSSPDTFTDPIFQWNIGDPISPPCVDIEGAGTNVIQNAIESNGDESIDNENNDDTNTDNENAITDNDNENRSMNDNMSDDHKNNDNTENEDENSDKDMDENNEQHNVNETIEINDNTNKNIKLNNYQHESDNDHNNGMTEEIHKEITTVDQAYNDTDGIADESNMEADDRDMISDLFGNEIMNDINQHELNEESTDLVERSENDVDESTEVIDTHQRSESTNARERNSNDEELTADVRHVRSNTRYNLRQRINSSQGNKFIKTRYNFMMIKNMKTRYGRVKNRSDYIHSICNTLVRINNNMPYNYDKLQRDVIGLCMVQQMSAKKGIEKFGERALVALAKEYAQLDDLNVFIPKHINELTREEIKKALNAIDLIAEKRCGKIKGRTVADGRKQRPYYNKYDTSSPALGLEAIICTLIIDAAERRHIAIADVSGAFLKAEMKEFVLVRLQGPAVEAILRANRARYEKYVTMHKGIKVLYLQLRKAMYGTLMAALLWYELFANTIKSMGFVMNPYNACVANKEKQGKQFTICWYVNDLKLSHDNPAVVKEMINTLQEKFGEMNVEEGNKFTYLGMDIEIREQKVHIMMRSYIQECIDSFGEAINTCAATPATNALMNIDEKVGKLDDRRAKIYHHIVAKLLYVCKRSRLDIQVAIAFLCTRVKCPNIHDWLKLRRVLQYLRGTIDLCRTISMSSFYKMQIFVDASHAVHHDMRSHTGGCVSMGFGVIHSRSAKQTLNSRSSTESELIGSSDYLPYVVWLLYFFESQGYRIKKKLFHQDNQSTIRILKNGKKSGGKQSRHVNIRYFWTADRIREHSLEVEYCPTLMMVGDFFTKPLQGSLFRRMRDVVMGLRDISTLDGSDNESWKNWERKGIKIDGGSNNVSTNREERVEEVKKREY